MLTPIEQIKMDELKKKSENYVPLTEVEIKEADELNAKILNQVSREILQCSEPWARLCKAIAQLGLINKRLFMDLNYHKSRNK